ncbi:MAG: hypothetical protein FWC40_00620 [Proteobacteria bacterium]|nr:hypothetical protein [Pseudomonadota bacterium]
MKKFLLPAAMMTLVIPAPAFACIGRTVFFCDVDIAYQSMSASGSGGVPASAHAMSELLEEEARQAAKFVACRVLCENAEAKDVCTADCNAFAEYKEVRCMRRCYQTQNQE